jgi:hypothetical protein
MRDHAAHRADRDHDAAQRPAPKPMKILLVGASGMIGSRILAEAAGRGHALIAAPPVPPASAWWAAASRISVVCCSSLTQLYPTAARYKTSPRID